MEWHSPTNTEVCEFLWSNSAYI